MLGISSGPNPLTVPLGQRGDVEFEVFDHAGQPLPGTEVHDRFRAIGLDCGYRLELRFRMRRITTVVVKLIHMANPAEIEALSGGNVVDSGATDPTQGVAQLVTLAGRAIDQVVITPPSDETALIEVCAG